MVIYVFSMNLYINYHNDEHNIDENLHSEFQSVKFSFYFSPVTVIMDDNGGNYCVMYGHIHYPTGVNEISCK